MSNDNNNTDLENAKIKLEVEKLQEEVKKTRRENRLWIIGLLLAVAGFGLGNLKTIQSLVIREPRVRLIVEDPFVKRVGMVRIVNTSGSRNIVVATAVKPHPQPQARCTPRPIDRIVWKRLPVGI